MKVRDQLLEVIAELSKAAPNLRFGQWVANLATLARGPEVESIWDSEDDELLVAARRLAEHYRARQTGAA